MEAKEKIERGLRIADDVPDSHTIEVIIVHGPRFYAQQTDADGKVIRRVTGRMDDPKSEGAMSFAEMPKVPEEFADLHRNVVAAVLAAAAQAEDEDVDEVRAFTLNDFPDLFEKFSPPGRLFQILKLETCPVWHDIEALLELLGWEDWLRWEETSTGYTGTVVLKRNEDRPVGT